jgi:hypothetical protein
VRNQSRVFLAVLLILWGVIIIVGQIFDINVGRIFWPMVIILLGLWLVFRPYLGGSSDDVSFRPLGGIDRSGAWEVADEEIWMFVGDVELDLRDARFPNDEGSIRILAFVPDVDIYISEDVGLSVGVTAFVTDMKAHGEKSDSVFTPVDYQTENYGIAEQKLRVEITCFVADISIR